MGQIRAYRGILRGQKEVILYMDIDELWDDYLQYLIWRGNLEKFKEYSCLFAILHNIDFWYDIPRDENREADGADLRNDYNIPEEWYSEELREAFDNHWTSVFEVLLALAIRVDDEYIGDPSEEHPEDFFMEMIKNLGLDVFIGKRYKESDVQKIITRWLSREFKRNGEGSPFPLQYNDRDQRDLEIWDQMNCYISENYV